MTTTNGDPPAAPHQPLGLAGLAPLGLVLAPSLMHLAAPAAAPLDPSPLAVQVAARCVKGDLTAVHEVRAGKQDVIWHLAAGTRVQVVATSAGWVNVVHTAFGDPQAGWLKESELGACP